MKLEKSVRILCAFEALFVGIPNVQEPISSEKVPGRYMDGTLKVSRVT